MFDKTQRMADFEWQLFNVQKCGFDLAMHKAQWFSALELQDIFNKKLAKEINPVAITAEGTLGFQWYEWIAEASTGHEPRKYGYMLGARHFSWDYPQLKMVIHDAEFDKSDTEQDSMLDGVYFFVEFYS